MSSSNKGSQINNLTSKILDFRNARDWHKFHNAKDLSAALAIEASELQELFLWKKESELEELIKGKRERLSEEVADVAIYLLMLADATGLDLAECIERKLDLNAAKYPVEKARGKSDKYDQL